MSYFRPQLLPKLLLDKSQTPNACMSADESTCPCAGYDPRHDNLITGRSKLDLEQNHKQDQNKVQRIKHMKLHDICSGVWPCHFHISPLQIKRRESLRINRGSVIRHCSMGFIISGREQQQTCPRHTYNPFSFDFRLFREDEPLISHQEG